MKSHGIISIAIFTLGSRLAVVRWLVPIENKFTFSFLVSTTLDDGHHCLKWLSAFRSPKVNVCALDPTIYGMIKIHFVVIVKRFWFENAIDYFNVVLIL